MKGKDSGNLSNITASPHRAEDLVISWKDKGIRARGENT